MKGMFYYLKKDKKTNKEKTYIVFGLWSSVFGALEMAHYSSSEVGDRPLFHPEIQPEDNLRPFCAFFGNFERL